MTRPDPYGPFGRPIANISVGPPRAILFAEIAPGLDGRLRASGEWSALCPEHGPLVDDVTEQRARLAAYDHNASDHEGADAFSFTPQTVRAEMVKTMHDAARWQRAQVFLILANIVVIAVLIGHRVGWWAISYCVNAMAAAVGGYNLKTWADRRADSKEGLALFDAAFDLD